MTARRTIRRFAHELYPHADEWEVRPLSVEVPYLLAHAVGASVFGTGWMDNPALGRERVGEAMASIQVALLADALHQGLTGDEAWAWAACGADGQAQHETAFVRALSYGVPVSLIKPYPCGPVPLHHAHMASTGDVTGVGIVTRIDCPESECMICTEPAAVEVTGEATS